MTETYALAALWIGLALAAALASIWLRVATSLSEIVVGTLAGAVLGTAALGVDQSWVKLLAGAGAEHSRQYHRRLLAELKTSVATKGVKAHYEVAVGHPAEQIIYHADKYQADVIVVGDRGRSKFAKLLLGSISKNVVQYAGRAVLVVR